MTTLTGGLSAPLPLASGGTGSATQNFVDLTTGQTIAGAKVFNGKVIATTAGAGASAAVDASPGFNAWATTTGPSANWYDPANYAGYVWRNSNALKSYGLLVSDYWRATENYLFAVDGRSLVDGTLANDTHNQYFTIGGLGLTTVAGQGLQVGASGTVISASIEGTLSVTGVSIGAGGNIGHTITVTGATSGAVCAAGLPGKVGGILPDCISQAGSCLITMTNISAGALTEPSGTYRCRVFNP